MGALARTEGGGQGRWVLGEAVCEDPAHRRAVEGGRQLGCELQ